jgi:hypothetical protein
MSGQADVRSLAQLETLRERLALWRTGVLKETEHLQLELRKLTVWLEEDVGDYWRKQAVVAQQGFSEATEVLLRCESVVRMDEKRPCTEERKRVAHAKQRKELCEQKLRLVREARVVWERQLNKLRGRLHVVNDMADSDVQVTLGKLSQIIETLQAYARVSSSDAGSLADPAAAIPNAVQDGTQDSTQDGTQDGKGAPREPT